MKYPKEDRKREKAAIINSSVYHAGAAVGDGLGGG